MMAIASFSSSPQSKEMSCYGTLSPSRPAAQRRENGPAGESGKPLKRHAQSVARPADGADAPARNDVFDQPDGRDHGGSPGDGIGDGRERRQNPLEPRGDQKADQQSEGQDAAILGARPKKFST